VGAMPWDAPGSSPGKARWLWLTIAVGLLVLRGPAFIGDLRAKPGRVPMPEFFPQYAFARAWLEGRQAYPDHQNAAVRILGTTGKRSAQPLWHVQPPTLRTVSRSVILRPAIRHRQFVLSYSSRTALIGIFMSNTHSESLMEGCLALEFAVAATRSV
jgi:hypothetical protein